MLLNLLSQLFVIHFEYNWFYPEIVAQWLPVLKRRYLPYNTCEDFINAQITQVNFPGANTQNPSQNIGPYNVQKRPGLSLDQVVQKSLTLSIKNTESYIAYFMMRQQFDMFLKFGEKMKDLYMGNLVISLLDDLGFETVSYVYREMTMNGISDLNLQYSASLGQFNTFTAGFTYNFYDVYAVDENGRHLISEPWLAEKDATIDYLDIDAPKYRQHAETTTVISTKQSLRRAAKQFQPLNRNQNGDIMLSTSLNG